MAELTEPPNNFLAPAGGGRTRRRASRSWGASIAREQWKRKAAVRARGGETLAICEYRFYSAGPLSDCPNPKTTERNLVFSNRETVDCQNHVAESPAESPSSPFASPIRNRKSKIRSADEFLDLLHQQLVVNWFRQVIVTARFRASISSPTMAWEVTAIRVYASARRWLSAFASLPIRP